MNWHQRYVQQAGWTRELRNYLFDKAGLEKAKRVIEVGCGTGAVLADLSTPAMIHGLDLDRAALYECRLHAPGVVLTLGDGHSLPFSDESFDISFCHFLLLWVVNPLQAVSELKRVTRRGGSILALAEPDYSARIDQPGELAQLGQWQTESLERQGAHPSFGGQLAETFQKAGINLLETGPIQDQNRMRSAEERRQEWNVLEADLAGLVPAGEVQRLKSLDEKAWERGERILHVPTFFAWGKT
jgi:ubiquinone/menaquinone biosynthesis C-methylase UbiE